jgi:hypothetical protein
MFDLDSREQDDDDPDAQTTKYSVDAWFKGQLLFGFCMSKHLMQIFTKGNWTRFVK